MRRTAILVPGTLCDARVFASLADRLDLDCVMGTLGDALSIEDAAEALLASASASARFVGIGFSLGGFVVLEAMRRAPDRLIAIILLAGNAHPDAPGNAAVRRAEAAAARDTGMEAFFEERFPGYVAARFGDDRELRTLLTTMAIAIGHDGHARQAEMNITRPDLRAAVRTSSVPLLVVAGEEDRMCPRERFEAAAAGPLGVLKTLPDVGHFVPIEAAEETARVVNAWLSDLPA